MSAAQDAPGRFNILTVCTGNICRSPLAEYLLRAGLKRWGVADISSAGTAALVDHAMTDQTFAIAQELGVTAPERHRGRMLDVSYLRNANLVIALTRSHRSEIVRMLPRGSRHTFTLRELARLLAAITPADLASVASLPIEDMCGRFKELVSVAASFRGYVAPLDDDLDDDVIDPYRRGNEAYELSAAQLVPAVHTIVESFALAAVITPGEV